MHRTIAIALICSLCIDINLYMVTVHGRYYRMKFRVREVSYPRDIIRCYVYGPKQLKENSTSQIVLRQHLTNGSHVELSSCRLIYYKRGRCSARLVNGGCGRVNVTCSVVRNETEEEKISEEIFIAEKPSMKSLHINYKGVNNDNYTQIFPSGSLIKLICLGEVQIVNRDVLENLTFSWRNGVFKPQDPPTVKTTSTFGEKCKTDQTLSSFLYLKEQLDTELSCETKYMYTHFGGSRISRKSIRIKTIPERNQILGPVVVFKDEFEERSLLSLTCKTTTYLYNSAKVENIQWCIRKENSMQYVPLPLQEEPNTEIFNRTNENERTIKGSVLYQLLKNNENVEIICEINHSDTCGSGTLRGTVLFNSKPFKTPDLLQNHTDVTSEQSDQSDSTCVTLDEPNTLIYASTGVMIASIIILISGVAAFYKAKERVKYESTASPLTTAANTYHSIKDKAISEEYQNQTYSNTTDLSGRATNGVSESTESDNKGNVYESADKHDDDLHVYEEKIENAELYEKV